MAKTEKGAAFVSRMKTVAQVANAGTAIFAAMAAGLEDEDWILVYIASCKLARDVEEQGIEACSMPPAERG